MVRDAISRTGQRHQHRDRRAGIFRVALERGRRSGPQHRALQAGRLRRRGFGACAAVALSLLASAGHALSCLPYTLETAIQDVIDAPEGYMAVKGTLSIDAGVWPVTDWEKQHQTPALTRVPATLTGHALSRSGYSVPMTRQVTVDVSCAGPWCPGIPSANTSLVFVQTSKAGLSVTIGPCHSHVFESPSSEDLDTTKRRFLESVATE